jgi:hypothetical protein
MPNSTISSTALRKLWGEKARRNPADAAAWAMAHRVVGAGELLRDLPALTAIARDPSPLIVIQKSAQVGATELLVNLSLWAADTAYAGRGNVLFLMPTQNQMDDFAQARFDRAIQDSPYLRSRLQPEPPRRKGADSKRLKRVGPGYIFMRGAESARQVASVDADLVVLDEFDQMADGVLELARKRIASSSAGRIVVASTPRFPETGIHGLFLQSDQQRYLLTCTECGHEQALSWELNVDQALPAIVCARCRRPLDPARSPGRWVAEAPGNAIRGYHLSRLYSPWLDLAAMVEASRAPTPSAQQEFWNSDLGEPFHDPGGGLSLDVLDRCRRPYLIGDYAGERCVMGVDVGLQLHVVIRELPEGAHADPTLPRRLWYAGIVGDWDALHALMVRFHVAGVVVDSMPESHKAAEFVARYPYTAFVARYSRSEPGCEQLPAHDGRPPTLALYRNEALERAQQRFHDGVALLPAAARELGERVKGGIGEYYRELLCLRRVLEPDSQGNWTARWEGAEDHFAHAEAYCLYAERLVTPPAPPIAYVGYPSRWRRDWSGQR